MRRAVLGVLILAGLLLMGRTAAMRLLVSGGAGGAFTPPAAFVTITDAPNGGWTQIPDPKAYHYNGKTYLGWVDGTSGAIEHAAWMHATQSLSTPAQLADLGGPDNHDSPSVIVRESDKRLVVAYAGHLDTRVRVRISTNPEDASSFAVEQALDPGYGGVYTYATLVQLRGVTNDPIYLFARSIPNLSSQVGRLVYAKSTDGGATWGSWTVLFTGSASPALVPYWRIGTDWSTRIDVFTTQRSPNDSASQTHHFYLDGTDDSLHTSDGTEILTALPITTADMTVVLDSTNGPNWSWGASWDGAPAAVIMQAASSTDNRILVARWRSGAWQVDTVVGSVGGQLGINKYGSGAAIHHTDPDTVYIAIKDTKFEMWRYTSADDGATWSGTQLTSGSPKDNVWPEVPAFAASGLSAVWLYGDYTNDTSFSFGVRGAP